MKVGCVGGAGGGTFQGQASDDREQFSSLSRSESDKKPILLSLGYDARSDFGWDFWSIYFDSESFSEYQIFNWKHIHIHTHPH